MGSGPKTTTTSTNTQNGEFNNQGATSENNFGTSGTQQQQQTTNNATSTTTPNLPDWFMPFKQGLAGQFNQLAAQYKQNAQRPLYGQQQQAAFQENLNRQLGGARQDLMSQLASSGALNSGRADQAQTQLALGGAGQLGNYLAQVPLLNRQAQESAMQGQQGALNGAANLTVPYGQTTTSNSVQDMLSNLFSQFNNQSNGTSQQSGTNSQNSGGTQTQQQSGGLLQSILGGLLNSGLSALTGGLGNVLGGVFKGGGGNPSPQTLAALPQQRYTDPLYWGIPTH